MRITNKMMSNTFLYDMKNNLENIKKLQEQMTSGKEFRRPSDNPFKVARAMQLHTDINANKQYNENINDTINWLDTTDTAIGQVGDVFQRVRELLISAGNAGYGESERKAIKDEINEKVGELSQILNTNFDGKYIFGGTRGTTKPVDVLGGINFEGAVSTKKIVIDKSEDAIDSIVGKDGILKEDLKINIGGQTVILYGKKPDKPSDKSKEPAKIDNLSDLSSKINEEINKDDKLKGKIKCIPDIAGKKLMFVNTNEASGEGKSIDISINGGITMDKAQAKYNPDNSSNARLMYYKKGGGELVDDSEYSQIKGNLVVEISQGVKMEYNVSACNLLEFKDSKGENIDVRELLTNIVNHLDGKNGDGTELESSSIEKLVNGDLEKLTKVMDNVLKIRSEVGAKQNRMESARDKNVDSNFNMTEILSKTEDIDITEKTMEFAVMQSVYLASLQTSARVIQPSLLDYLR